MNPEGGSRRPAIPRTVWALGFVSLFMDISSEIIHGLLPLFLTTVLGASVALVGLIDGIAEATASISKVFSGYVSDRVGRRKPLILLGYGLGAASKPLFALAVGPIPILGARFVDRIGKGLRGAPRDALVADIAPAHLRGAAFGLRQSLDTAGAFIGPLLATALMLLWAGDFRAVFWVAVIPGALAVLVLALGVREPERAAPPTPAEAARGAAWLRRQAGEQLDAPPQLLARTHHELAQLGVAERRGLAGGAADHDAAGATGDVHLQQPRPGVEIDRAVLERRDQRHPEAGNAGCHGVTLCALLE